MKQLPFLLELFAMYIGNQADKIAREDTQLIHQETILMLRCWQEIFEMMAGDCERRETK